MVNHMKLITVHVTSEQVVALDKLVKRGWAPNRAELIRNAINDLLDGEL